MRRWMTAALVLVAAQAWAQDRKPQDAPDEGSSGQELENTPDPGATPAESAPRDPEMPAGVIVRGKRDAPALFVRLREPGVLQFRAGEEWKDATLDELSVRLRQFAEEQDREMQKDGKSAYTYAPGGMRVSRLFVSIDAGPTVPWQHVQWVLTMVAEQKYYKLELTDGTRTLLGSLPFGRGQQTINGEPAREIHAEVHAIGRAETPQKWGDSEVSRPTEIRFKMVSLFGQPAPDESTELPPVADYLRGAKKTAEGEDVVLVGTIKAGHKVPFSKVLALMETYEAAGIARVDFFGTAIPTSDLRKGARLPYPVANYGGR